MITAATNVLPAVPPRTSATPSRTVRAVDLLGAAHRLVIEHGNERYVLSLTRNGKLLLTK